MTEYLNPSHILMLFLRNRLTDPRARLSTTDDDYVATAGQTNFLITPPSGTVSCISAVTVESVLKKEWVDYYFQVRTNKVIFFTGLTVGDDVNIQYKYGTNWIHTGKPLTKIASSEYPRIGIKIISAPGVRLGNYEAPIESTILFSIDLWAKEKMDGQVFTINSQTYYGEELLNYLAMQLNLAFIDYENDLHPAMYNYSPGQVPRDLPFDDERQAHHKTCEISLKSINIGRI